MNNVQIEQKSYEMPPREGISIAHFLTVADVERSARYYEKVFGARILTMGDGNAPPYLQLANIWMILNVGGGPTPDKPTVTLSVPDPNHINSFMSSRPKSILVQPSMAGSMGRTRYEEHRSTSRCDGLFHELRPFPVGSASPSRQQPGRRRSVLPGARRQKN